jgi:AraC-like DNA-binding protein
VPPAATATTYGILNPHAARTHFELARVAPADDLAQEVERHWVIDWDLRGAAPFEQKLLPHPCVNMAFEAERAGVYGIPRAGTSRTIEGRGWALGTKFRPGGFSAFSPISMSELRDAAIPLERAFGAGADGLAEKVATSPEMSARIATVEDFLRRHRRSPDPACRLVLAIVAQMLEAAPDTRITAIAREHGLSVRSLQRLFRRYVGASPKWVLSRYRLQEAAERIATGDCDDFGALAQDLGYFDQPAFNRDFRRLVGCSPARYGRMCAAARAS